MAIPNFTYLAPKTLKEALSMRISHGEKSSIMAGGTDLLIKMAHRNYRPEFVIGLDYIKNIDYVRYNNHGDLAIGPMTKLSSVMDDEEVMKHFPALAHSSSVTATVQIRNMSTLIGNIVNAAPTADNATPLLVYDSRVIIMSEAGERELALEDFFVGHGTSILKPNELIKEIILPLPANKTGSSYQKISTRSKVDIAGVCASYLLSLDDKGYISKARIALGAVAPTPIRFYEAEKLLEGKKPTSELFKEAAIIARKATNPRRSQYTAMRASAEYRIAMIEVLTIRGLEACLESATKKKL